MNTMKKLLVALLCMTLVMSVALPAMADENDRTLSITGTANISLKPDFATVTLGVSTMADTVSEAQAENAVMILSVIEALKACGLTEDDIYTSNFNVSPEYDYNMQQQIIGYSVSNMLTIKVSDVNAVGTVLDAAMNAGANRSYGISFGSTAENDAYDKALGRAVEDAAHKAQVLAAASGVTLGQIININATSGGYNYGISNTYRYDAKDSAAGTTIIEGDVTVSASVTLVYEIQ